MLAGLLGLIILFVRLFPKTPFGTALHFYCVELPLLMAHRLERRHLILLFILLCSGQMLAMMGSAELALAYAADLSIYYDAVITASLAAAAAYVRNAWASFTRITSRWIRMVSRPRSRSRRQVTAARDKAPANDDDPAWIGLRAA